MLNTKTRNSLYMSLLRGVTYCAHPIGERQLIPADRFTKKVDQGENNYSFRLTVASRAGLERKTAEFVQKPYALNIFPIPSNVACKGPDISLGGDVISVPTVKKMDGRDAVIFRLQNNTPDRVETHLQVNGERLPLDFGKYEAGVLALEDVHLEGVSLEIYIVATFLDQCALAEL